MSNATLVQIFAIPAVVLTFFPGAITTPIQFACLGVALYFLFLQITE